ncbi:MAG: PEP-CTERM sorting domain-containing protein [Pseudomonadota bacterium]
MRFLTLSAAAALFAGPAFAIEVPVDLSDWTAEGDGNWSLEAGNNAVVQTINGLPTVFYGPGNARGNALRGTIEVQTTGDDDFIGFVLGYNAGELAGGPTDFILVDWKQALQDGYDPGLAISHVTGPVVDGSTSDDYWQHTDTVNLLTRSNAAGALYANTGWSDNTEYEFDLEFFASNIKVYVDGNLEIDVNAADYGLGSFSDGAFGFYNFSQPNVRYAGITEETLPPPTGEIPLPGALPLMAAALGGLALLRRRG